MDFDKIYDALGEFKGIIEKFADMITALIAAFKKETTWTDAD